jgi:hypothetical protein
VSTRVTTGSESKVNVIEAVAGDADAALDGAAVVESAPGDAGPGDVAPAHPEPARLSVAINAMTGVERRLVMTVSIDVTKPEHILRFRNIRSDIDG